MTPDLQRIVEALKACRERYEVRLNSHGTAYRVFDHAVAANVFYDTQAGCEQWVDARCAEAMVRAIREPSAEMEVAGTEQWLCEAAMEDRSGANWRAMCDAILGETQL